MMNLYNTIDKWMKIIISLSGLVIFSIMMVTGFDYSWGIVAMGAIGVLGFGRMLKNTLENNK